MIVLKLGGSVITAKDRPETLDGESLERAADAIADSGAVTGLADGSADSRATTGAADGSATAGGGPADSSVAGGTEPLVIVHGGGSFGHHNASEHGVTTTDGTHDPAAVHDIHGAMTTLNAFVLRRLVDRGIPAVPVHPFSAGHRDADGDLALPTGQVETLLSEGFVPVLHGDLIAHVGEGTTVVSGDELVTALATALEADRIGLCSTVPGVLDDAESVIEEITAYDDVADVLGGSDATDVTGGMAAKVRALLALEADASIFGDDALEAFLAGEQPGTTIR